MRPLKGTSLHHTAVEPSTVQTGPHDRAVETMKKMKYKKGEKSFNFTAQPIGLNFLLL